MQAGFRRFIRLVTTSLNLVQLRAFAVVAECNSFTRAAETLKVTQPYISGQIASLETKLGLSLFNRVGRRVYLSEAGVLFLPYVTKVFESLRDAERSLDEFRGVVTGHVRIAASSTPGAYILPRILQQFLKDHPGVEVSIQIKDKVFVEQMLLKQQVELGVIASEPISKELSTETLGVDRLLLIVNNDHSWAKGKAVSLKDVEGQRLVVREGTSGTRILIENELKGANVNPLARIEFSTNDAIKEAVAAGLGVAFLSERTVRSDIEAHRVTSVPVLPQHITRIITLSTLSGHKLSPAAAVLRNTIIANFASC
jgi:LysR family transcriptional regulator, low CO2-responsive transcriptional regulator